VTIDGQAVTAPSPMSDRSWTAHFVKSGSKWSSGDFAGDSGLRKRHGLQGPVDDAFLDSFIFVRPTGSPIAAGIAGWVSAEQAHAIKEWRRQFRGEAQVRDDTQISDAEIAGSHLVLWGDPGSNRVLARMADKLPVRWNKDALTLGARQWPASTHA